MQTINTADEYEALVEELGEVYEGPIYYGRSLELSESLLGSYVDIYHERTYTVETRATTGGVEAAVVDSVLNPYSVIEHSRHYPDFKEFDTTDTASVLAQHMLAQDLNRVCKYVETLQ
jgi:hypothetical protein